MNKTQKTSEESTALFLICIGIYFLITLLAIFTEFLKPPMLWYHYVLLAPMLPVGLFMSIYPVHYYNVIAPASCSIRYAVDMNPFLKCLRLSCLSADHNAWHAKALPLIQSLFYNLCSFFPSKLSFLFYSYCSKNILLKYITVNVQVLNTEVIFYDTEKTL